MGFSGEKAFQALLTVTGEYADRELEKEYTSHEVKYSKRFVRPAVLLLGVLYFSFVIADHYLVKNGQIFNLLMINRILFLSLSILFSLWLKRINNPGYYYLGVTAYEVVGTVFLMHIFKKYETPVFLIQSLNVLIVLLVIYIIPNRWIFSIITSLGICIGFYSLAIGINSTISPRELSASIVHTALVVILFGISAYRINRYKRKQYADNKELIRLSSRDALTGIYNRYRFEEELQRCTKHANRYGTRFSLVLFDIDNFKVINDKFGHLIGDRVLVEFTEVIKTEIRETDFFSRWGGEEFALILTDTEKEDATLLANRLRARICSTFFNPVGQVTCSFGIDAFLPGDDVESLFQRVDRLMYLAKQSGKDQVIDALK